MGAPAATDGAAPAVVAPAEALEDRLVDAMRECIGRWGVAKTTADDIARAAGVSRATLYRAFPGGKDVAFEALVRHEVHRFFAATTDRLHEAHDLEDLLVVGITGAARFLSGHDALRYVLTHEPERILPELAFHRLQRALDVAVAFATPHLRRFVRDSSSAEEHAEWIVRILLSYAMNPSPTLDLTDHASVRRFVATYLLPGLETGSAAHPPASKELTR